MQAQYFALININLTLQFCAESSFTLLLIVLAGHGLSDAALMANIPLLTQSPPLYLWECLNVQSMQHIIFCIPSLNLFLYSKLRKDKPDQIDSILSLILVNNPRVPM